MHEADKPEYFKDIASKQECFIESWRIIGRTLVPLGEKYFDETKLKTFHIEKLDNIYDIRCKDDGEKKSVFIVGRVDYDGKPVFIRVANYNETLIDDPTDPIPDILLMWGHMLISTDANALVKSIVDLHNIKRLRESMDRDGIKLDEDIEEYCRYYSLMERNIHPFEDMRALNIDDFKRCIYSRKNIMPDAKIDGFIEFVELKYYYEKNIPPWQYVE